jgi:predicted lysophospholipase L1 biosynthesis ABC-type transport system permease subunit
MAFIKQLGDIGFVLRAILGAVFFTLLFLTGNTMMQSVRERIPELAVLKTLGFSDGKVLGLVLAESLLLCVLAAVIGLGVELRRAAHRQAGAAGRGALAAALAPGIGVAVLLALIVGCRRRCARCGSISSMRWRTSAERGAPQELCMFKQLAPSPDEPANLPQRLGASSVIVIGIAGVVAVLVSVLAMGAGSTTRSADGGRDDRVIILRGGSDAELNSNLTRTDIDIISNAPGLAKDAAARPCCRASS